MASPLVARVPLETFIEKATLEYLIHMFDSFMQWRNRQKARLAQMGSRDTVLAVAVAAHSRPYVNQSVRLQDFASATDGDERDKFLERARVSIQTGLNTFQFPAEMVTGVDLLSDSGTTAMDASQWAALQTGDEAYGSNKGWYEFNETVRLVFGAMFGNPYLGYHPVTRLNKLYKYNKNFVFLFHQGRAAEGALFQSLVKILALKHGAAAAGEWYVGFNCAFDTTGAQVINLSDALLPGPDGELVEMHLRLREFVHPKIANGSYEADDKFLGNGNMEAIRAFVEEHHKRIPLWYITITNNKGGGQPVSLAHIEEVSDLCHQYNIPVFLDACRFAENAYFVKRDEHPELSIEEIVHQTFSFVDGFHSSFKKDGLVNMGGGLVLRADGLFTKKYISAIPGEPCISQMLTDFQILNEGHPTYGGLSGRDIRALNQGLRLVLRESYLNGRIRQVIRFGSLLALLGVPVLQPVGGSAVYIDIDRFFDDEAKERRSEYLGSSLVALLLSFGHRLCELGAFAFSGPTAPFADAKDVQGNYVRGAIPRMMYSDTDLQQCALILAFLYAHRSQILPVLPQNDCQKLSLHHFKARFLFDLSKWTLR